MPQKLSVALGAGSAGAERGHIPALDGLRGLAALMVMVFHWPWDFQNPWLLNLARAKALGQSGVDLFFVLSGFLITGILLDARGAPHFLRNFYMRRVLRIFPLYYTTVLVYFGVLWLRTGKVALGSFVGHLFYLQSLTPLARVTLDGPGHFWSLAVEEHFYLLWPLLVLVCRRRRDLVVALLLIMLAALVSRCFLVPRGYGVFFITFCRFDAIALGSLLAVVGRTPRGMHILARGAPWALLALLTLAVPMYTSTSGERLVGVQVIKYLLWALVYGGLLILAVARHTRLLPRFFCLAPLRLSGKYSYALYVFHPFIFLSVEPWKARGVLGRYIPHDAAVVLWMLLAVALTYAGAILSWHAYEKHFLGLKRYFSYGQRAPATALAVKVS